MTCSEAKNSENVTEGSLDPVAATQALLGRSSRGAVREVGAESVDNARIHSKRIAIKRWAM